MSDLLHTKIARMNGNSDIFKLAHRLHRIVASKVMDLYEMVILFPCKFFYERIEGSVFPKQICAYNSFSACGEFARKICVTLFKLLYSVKKACVLAQPYHGYIGGIFYRTFILSVKKRHIAGTLPFA